MALPIKRLFEPDLGFLGDRTAPLKRRPLQLLSNSRGHPHAERNPCGSFRQFSRSSNRFRHKCVYGYSTLLSTTVALPVTGVECEIGSHTLGDQQMYDDVDERIQRRTCTVKEAAKTLGNSMPSARLRGRPHRRAADDQIRKRILVPLVALERKLEGAE